MFKINNKVIFNFRGLFRTQLNISGALLGKYLTGKSLLFEQVLNMPLNFEQIIHTWLLTSRLPARLLIDFVISFNEVYLTAFKTSLDKKV